MIKERDELLAKFHNSKGEQVKTPNSAPLSNIETTLLAKETQTDEVAEEHTQSNDYLSDVMKISQLSQELTKKNEYLEKSETKIVQLKSDLSDSRQQIKDLNGEITKLRDSVEGFRQREDKFVQEITDSNNHINFLQLENTMLVKEKQKILSTCPDNISDLSAVKLIPKPEYRFLVNCQKRLKQVVRAQKNLERNAMQLNDTYTLSTYHRKMRWDDTTLTTETKPGAI